MPRNRKESLPPVPPKGYFTSGEAVALCGVSRHVLTYWEEQFPQLRPVRGHGEHRRYRYAEILLIRRIREMLYKEGFTIRGAREQLNASSLRGMRAQAIQESDADAIAGELRGILKALEQKH